MTTEPELALGPFAERGFTLEPDGDDIVFLLHEGETIARFSQTGATERTIQAEAAIHLAKEHAWDGCLIEQVQKR